MNQTETTQNEECTLLKKHHLVLICLEMRVFEEQRAVLYITFKELYHECRISEQHRGGNIHSCSQ